MTIDVINVDSYAMKSALVSAYEQHNNVKVAPVIDTLSVETVCDKNAMLQDPITKSGIVFKKVVLRDLFPKTITIRPFKNKPTFHTNPFPLEYINQFNAKHGIELVSAEKDILKGMSPFSVTAIRDFVLFCRVFGFYELDVGDVSIFEHDGVLTISVNDTHKLFTGYIEVLV